MLQKLTDVLREVFWIKPIAKKNSPDYRGKRGKKKVAKKSAKPAKKPLLDPDLARVGEITHYFDRIKVAVVKITSGTILIGDRLTVVPAKGSGFVQKIWSMQVESKDVKVARKGQLIGIKVDKPVAAGDMVYK